MSKKDNRIKLIAEQVELLITDRNKNNEKFLEYYRWILRNISKEVLWELDDIDSVCKEDYSYRVEFTLKDYKWWCLKMKKEKITLIPLRKIKDKVEKKIFEVYDNLEVDEEYQDIDKKLKEFDEQIKEL